MRRRDEPGHTKVEIEAINRWRSALQQADEAACEVSRSLNARNAYSREMAAAHSALLHAQNAADEVLTLDEFAAVTKVSATSRKMRGNTRQADRKATLTPNER